MAMTALNFNINNYIWVKLTTIGKQMWKDRLNIAGMPARYHLNDEKIEAKKNDQGYWEFQMHEFIDIFGAGISFSLTHCGLPIEADIKIIMPLKLTITIE